RDERGGLLGRHDAREPSGLERVALLDCARANQPARFARHRDRPARDRFTIRDRLFANIDHLDTAPRIYMREHDRCVLFFNGGGAPPPPRADADTSPRLSMA